MIALYFPPLGLIIARLLISSDDRLRQLFNHNGGSQLLMAMTGYTSGILRTEVAVTLSALAKCKINRFFQWLLPQHISCIKFEVSICKRSLSYDSIRKRKSLVIF